MATAPQARLNGVELERRLVANAALSATSTMSDMGSMEPAGRLAAVIAGVNAEPQGGRVLVTVNVSESCPACTLRLAGATRSVGDGVTSAMFRVPLGARTILVEMSDDRGRFVPVMRVELGPDGRVLRQTVLSAGDDGPLEAAAGHESGMAMPMAGDDASMASHAGGATGGGAMSVAHDRMDVTHALATMSGHVADTQPHFRPGDAGTGAAAEHMPPESGRSGDTSDGSHVPEDADPFADAPAAVQDSPSDGGHGPSVRFWPFHQALPWAQAVDDDAEAIAEIVDPMAPLPPLIVTEPYDTTLPITDQGESTWPIAAGGAAATFAFFAASRALERRARWAALNATTPLRDKLMSVRAASLRQ
jgi:hypothetical protein